MGKTFENLTWDDLCDLMCGGPEDEWDEEKDEREEDTLDNSIQNNGGRAWS